MPIPRFVLDDGDREGRFHGRSPGGCHALKRSRPTESAGSPGACSVGDLLRTCRKFGVESRGSCRAWGHQGDQPKAVDANENHNLLKSDARIPEPQKDGTCVATAELFSLISEPFGEDFELGPPPPCPPSLCRQKAMDLSAGCPLKQAALSLAKKYSSLRRQHTPTSMVSPPTACFARLSLSRDRKRPTDL